MTKSYRIAGDQQEHDNTQDVTDNDGLDHHVRPELQTRQVFNWLLWIQRKFNPLGESLGLVVVIDAAVLTSVADVHHCAVVESDLLGISISTSVILTWSHVNLLDQST